MGFFAFTMRTKAAGKSKSLLATPCVFCTQFYKQSRYQPAVRRSDRRLRKTGTLQIVAGGWPRASTINLACPETGHGTGDDQTVSWTSRS